MTYQLLLLRHYNFGENFEEMETMFSDKKPSARFKDKKVTMSKLDKVVSVRMILYAAYHAVALYECIPNFARASDPAAKQIFKSRKPPHETKQNIQNVN